MKNYSAQILRSLRKFYEIKQSEFAPIIDTSQSALSKIEAGILELSASQWLSVCQNYNLDPRCLFSGKIENLGERKLKVEDHKSVGGYTIPSQYGYLMGSTVRTAYPLIKFMRMRLGEMRSDAYLRSTGFDLDYFLIMNNPLNLKFSEHLVMFLISEGCLKLDNVGSIMELGQFKDIHSSISTELGDIDSFDQATRKLLARVKTSYELNTTYEFLGEKEFVRAIDQSFLKEFKLAPEFNEFREKFNLSHFQGLNAFVSHSEHKLKTKHTSNGWLILKAA